MRLRSGKIINEIVMEYSNNQLEFKPIKNIGPSYFGTILGMNPYQTVEQLRKLIETGMRVKSNYACENGIKLESYAIQEYEKLTNTKVVKPYWIRPSNRILGVCDGIISQTRGLEIKCPVYNEGCDFSKYTTIPNYYLVQLVGYMAFYKRESWDYYVCLFDSTKEPYEKKFEYKETIYFKDYKDIWNNVWYPRILSFIETTRWYE